jgi:hypothetical protein
MGDGEREKGKRDGIRSTGPGVEVRDAGSDAGPVPETRGNSKKPA